MPKPSRLNNGSRSPDNGMPDDAALSAFHFHLLSIAFFPVKILFFSDAHGSALALQDLKKRIEDEKPDLICFLGDAIYHGPRNAIQSDYAPKAAIELFNSIAEKLIAVRGNCDTEVDQMVLKFPCLESYTTVWADRRRFFLTHGHLFDAGNLPPLPPGTVIATGHTHIPRLEQADNGRILLNPGSISIPKNGSVPSYATYADGRFSLRALMTGSAYAELDAPPVSVS